MIQKFGLGPTSDFSPIASRYDATRELPWACLKTCYDRLVRRGLLPPRGVILDAGCGTGQVSLPLADLGYEIRGLDVSTEMISIANAKCRSEWRARYIAADVRAIPEDSDGIDAVVVSKLFQHVQDWETACREIFRVLKPGACMFHLNETGAFVNPVRKHFAETADKLGFVGRYVGLQAKSDLLNFLSSLGCCQLRFDATDIRWNKQITYGEALNQLRDRLFAEFWYLSPDTYDLLLADTSRWVEEQPGGRSRIEYMTPYLVAEVFQKPGSA